jgi:hypothetical protein
MTHKDFATNSRRPAAALAAHKKFIIANPLIAKHSEHRFGAYCALAASRFAAFIVTRDLPQSDYNPITILSLESSLCIKTM